MYPIHSYTPALRLAALRLGHLYQLAPLAHVITYTYICIWCMHI